MSRVHKLTDELANQIAAGEVVERPASVVKELVENALDAGATRVTVDVEHGGTQLIRVADDGEGMSESDALLALERHATSKIGRLEDLSDLMTFGFRGEALPSIASVSRLSLETRARGAQEGCAIEVAPGGPPPSVTPAGRAIGTAISVRDLFFNVPARRKFLKATSTESAHISDVVLGAALSRPEVTFVLTRDGRIVRELLRAGDRAERAREALSGDALALASVRGERGPIRIEALLAPPERARAGATGLSLLVNGRPVRDRMLARAVAHAYGSVLEPGRYPVGVVWIDLPSALVDVNVHPQKAEVRFADARHLFDAIARELHIGLAKAFSIPGIGGGFASRAGAPALSTLGHAAATAAARGIFAGEKSSQAPALLSEENLFAAQSSTSDATKPVGDLFGERGLYASLRFAAQVRATFLVCEGSDGLYVLDQHAAAERVTFDRLRRAWAARGIGMQKLLVPEIVELTAEEVSLLDESASAVQRLGMEVRGVGEAAVAVHGVPDLLGRRADPARLVRDLSSELSRSGARAYGAAIDLVLATMACHGSVRAGDAMTREEVEALLAALDAVDFAGHCPHGRPLLVRMPWGELERKVGR